jgi:hypothetical protein
MLMEIPSCKVVREYPSEMAGHVFTPDGKGLLGIIKGARGGYYCTSDGKTELRVDEGHRLHGRGSAAGRQDF